MPTAIPGVEILRSTEELDSIRLEWERLWGSTDRTTPFQHPAWLIPWWRHVGEGELHTLAQFEEGRLVSLWPMYLHDDRLLLLGAGTSDYCDGLGAPPPVFDAPRDFFDLPAWSPFASDRCSVCPRARSVQTPPKIKAPELENGTAQG